ncbi:flavodoxin domain-containing protein [Bacillus alkalisoli]|uniref:flavodoxin domain-containing protein n=1 Tax=Bacillus alkalisoli TaxID=2011008 RepID=UPI000C2394A7|nr:flavodoxin domain-containing protein [Bacillus alkalisoli]
MKCAIIYSSVTGNTKELAEQIYTIFLSRFVDVHLFSIHEFKLPHLSKYDAVVIGTYSWGNGEIPEEMQKLYNTFSDFLKSNVVTAVFGTGDSFYPHYCGAVDKFTEILYTNTNLAATLKVELLLQEQDLMRCQMFVESVIKRSFKK